MFDKSYSYTYYDNGLKKTYTGPEGVTYTYAYNDNNQLTADWNYNPNNELQAYNGVSFQYDANGNTIQKTDGSEITHYITNEEDRLVRVEDGSSNVIAEYDYDPFGRRLWKEIDGERTWFLYSDEGPVAEMDAAGNVTKSYGWQPGSTWTTDPLFVMEGGQYYFYHNDHLGTP